MVLVGSWLSHGSEYGTVLIVFGAAKKQQEGHDAFSSEKPQALRGETLRDVEVERRIAQERRRQRMEEAERGANEERSAGDERR